MAGRAARAAAVRAAAASVRVPVLLSMQHPSHVAGRRAADPASAGAARSGSVPRSGSGPREPIGDPERLPRGNRRTPTVTAGSRAGGHANPAHRHANPADRRATLTGCPATPTGCQAKPSGRRAMPSGGRVKQSAAPANSTGYHANPSRGPRRTNPPPPQPDRPPANRPAAVRTGRPPLSRTRHGRPGPVVWIRSQEIGSACQAPRLRGDPNDRP
ncbi:hypothetical protein SAFG77S_08328 [Streptomyces afghaniensis]